MAIPKSILFAFIFFCLLKKIQLGCSTLHCLPNERNALFDFKQGFIDQTNRLSSWVGQDCCKWEGVSCDNFTGHVVMLDLRNPIPFDYDRTDVGFIDDKTYMEACLIAVGEVNPSLLELKHLNYLDLSWNNFSGISIPKFFGLFSELTYLNLSNALFGGIVPHHLGNLSALHSLDLRSDHIFGLYTYNPSRLVVNTLHWTSSLNSLQILDMSGIDLSNIPIDSFQAITSFPFLLELYFFDCSLKIPLFHSGPYNLTSLTILDLSLNKFQGPIPSAFRNMTSLKVLNLHVNKFSSNGSILDELKNLNKLEVLGLSFNEFAGKMNKFGFPNFSSLSIGDNLLKLDLSYNFFTGYLPNWLHQLMSHLNIINLSANLFEGEIPTSFGALQSLKQLRLAGNKLTGRIPTSLCRMATLTNFDLSKNQLSGQIPKSIGQLSKLTSLNLGSNRFHGVVSESHFAKLSKLKFLYLGDNSLSIKLRSGWVPPFQLDTIDLGSCRFLGHQFPDWLQTQTGLIDLRMSNTGISDSIPNWFHNLTSLVVLDLSGNQIYGRVPNFKTRNMRDLSLSSNLFEGPLPLFPSNLGNLDLSNNKICGPIQTDIGYTLPYLEFLSLSNNLINGTIPKSLCKLMMSLALLDFAKNNLSGALPHCLGDLHEVVVIDFTSNSLSGTIQRSFFHELMHLTSLHLSKNNFHGELPLSLQNCTSLSILDVSDNKFSGEIPTWIGKSPHSLRILKLSSNMYNGGLSPMLCHLNNLQVLDVANNNLTGNIPCCFGNFKAMLFNQTSRERFSNFVYEDKLSQVIKGKYDEYTKNLRFLNNLDLSNNNFIGKIPEQLTNLSGLLGLNLSRNHLTGSIPMKIGEMRSLESLDLSYNCLSGTIPQSISAATFLSHLNLSTNNLSGPIPLGNQFHTFNDPSIYSGNNELCGPPLEKSCTYVDRKEGKEKGDGDGAGDGFITMWFYTGLAWGCVVGFWGFGGVLLFKKSWRYAYFQFVNDIVDRLFHRIAKRKV